MYMGVGEGVNVAAKSRMLNIEVVARGLMELTMQVNSPACAGES